MYTIGYILYALHSKKYVITLKMTIIEDTMPTQRTQILLISACPQNFLLNKFTTQLITDIVRLKKFFSSKKMIFLTENHFPLSYSVSYM